MVLTDLANLNQRRLLEDSKVQNSFQIVGSEAKMRFDKHTTTKKSLHNFQLGQYQRSQTGHELIRRHERS
jgi:hypothetical protein